jgi:hypothetical protein
MSVPMLMCRSECPVTNKADRKASEAAKMKFLIFNLNERIQQSKNNWYEYILRMDPRRITQQVL